MGCFARPERDLLDRGPSGRRPILRNFKNTVRYSCAISNLRVRGEQLLPGHLSHVRCVDARVQLSFWRAIRAPQICTLDAFWRTPLRTSRHTRRRDRQWRYGDGGGHWPGNIRWRRPGPQNQSAFRAAAQGRLFPDRHRVSRSTQAETGQLPVLAGCRHSQRAQKEAHSRRRNSDHTVGSRGQDAAVVGATGDESSGEPVAATYGRRSKSLSGSALARSSSAKSAPFSTASSKRSFASSVQSETVSRAPS
jgi:hypothetical protein